MVREDWARGLENLAGPRAQGKSRKKRVGLEGLEVEPDRNVRTEPRELVIACVNTWVCVRELLELLELGRPENVSGSPNLIFLSPYELPSMPLT